MKPQKRGPSIPRSVVAQMRERYIFNFRVRPDALARHLPVKWLAPQIINGWSALSFCILRLERITIWPFPALFNFSTISCAYRIGVMDLSGDVPEPSVYITDRNADLPIIIRTAPLVFADAIPALKASIEQTPHGTKIQLRYMDGQPLFSGETSPTQQLGSEVFGSIDDFADFIKGGVSSYTPSVLPDTLARVDLHKEDIAYQPMDATVDFSWLDGVWPDAGMEFDSAVFASGAKYTWTYRGLWAEPASPR
ncbi:MAG TPA: hypothetical protein VJA46_00460 [Acidimicrobiia bacterium]|nr:hypothetical protein [Acidimicrobiia bacterium]